jgi:hypothetical protein
VGHFSASGNTPLQKPLDAALPLDDSGRAEAALVTHPIDEGIDKLLEWHHHEGIAPPSEKA